jgi:hypothetical protein
VNDRDEQDDQRDREEDERRRLLCGFGERGVAVDGDAEGVGVLGACTKLGLDITEP